ncbi:MAG: hypothetical protein GY929_27170, partial [Actinomycetia bacterium]|nr:hypothetical protein [Actinomycetes bacterium]
MLEYDGVSWHLIPVSNRSIGRSLTTDGQGRVFVGAVGELGYLAPVAPQGRRRPGALGRMRYVSLVEHLAPDDRAFSNVWRIEKTTGGVYFRVSERLFRWNGQQMKVWRSETRFLQIFTLRDTLYVQQEGIGLMRIVDDSLAMAPGGDLFQDKRIFGLVPQGEAAYLVITRSHGMFRCARRRSAEAACTPFNPGLTDLLATLEPYHATTLPGAVLAIGTRRGGVVLLDRAGRLLRILNEASRLRDENVRYTYVDRQGGLWLGLNNGLARVETGTALSYYDKTLGLLGSGNSIARHQGRLYAATSLGVYSLAAAAEGAAPHFLPYPGPSTECWSLLPTPQGLLAGCGGGLYNLDEHRRIWRLSEGHVHQVVRTRRDSTLLYLALSEGLARMRLHAGRWTDAGRIDGIRERVRSIVEDAQGRFWLGTQTGGVLRLEAAASDQPAITRFGVANGLPEGSISTRSLAGRVVFLSNDGNGLLRIDTGADTIAFVPDTTFDSFLPQGAHSINEFTEDEQGRVWIVAGAASGVAHPQAGGGYTFVPTALGLIPARGAYTMYAEAGGTLWLGGPYGLIRYDTNRLPDPATDYPVWIRRITTPTDSLLFDGQITQPEAAPAWSYRDNALRFAFAAPRYDAPEHTRYRTRLDGTGDDWSAWSEETDKDYTNLWEGRYVFRVQARDVYGRLSREDSFAFRILPPWYRAWWAWALYGSMAAGLIWGGVRLRTRSLKRLNAELEQRVRERTAELKANADELAAKNDELERFAYTVSHDLKSPLVTIQGFLGFLERDVAAAANDPGAAERVAGDVSRIRGAASKMRRLIDDLLELSRIGRGVKAPEEVAMAELAGEVRELLTGQVAERGAEVVISPDLPLIRGDRTQMHQVLQNLIQNALQYMGDQPAPRIEVGVRPGEGGRAGVLFVRDNGAGIAPEHQEKIFELFQRLGAETEGTGVGLALVQRIVEAHGGRI